MNEKKPHIALFGGSFNPIHKGHVSIVQELLKMEVELVVIMPTGCSPFKSKQTLLPKNTRWNMVTSVFSSWNRVHVSDLEICSSKISYTEDTLKQLQVQFPDFNWSIVIGSDLYPDFYQWKNATELLQQCSLWVIERTMELKDTMDLKKECSLISPRNPLLPLHPLFPSHSLHWDAEKLRIYQGDASSKRELVRFLQFPIPAISSTAIRRDSLATEWIPEEAAALYFAYSSQKTRKSKIN